MIGIIKDSVKFEQKLEYSLIPQTPIIHFQHAEHGSTLRATEVKPKFDKFLLKKAEEDGIALGEKYFIPNTKNQSFDYKLRLVEKKRLETYNVGRNTDYDIYYGNQGLEDRSKEKKAVMSEVLMTVMCADKDLRALIDKYVGEFFIVTNFGSMSGKGFGSFLVEDKKFSESDIAKALKKATGSYNCYAFNGGENPFKRIKVIYTIMKSGMSVPEFHDSALFNYLMYENKIALYGEKEGLRANQLVPLQPEQRIQKRYYYLRALLGVGDRAEYRIGHDRFTITMKEENNEIERLESPIFFKVINKRVYIVANRINREIYGKSFIFKKGKNGPSCRFSVPTEEMLNDIFIDDFLWCAIDYINSNASNSRLLSNITITEVQ